MKIIESLKKLLFNGGAKPSRDRISPEELEEKYNKIKPYLGFPAGVSKETDIGIIFDGKKVVRIIDIRTKDTTLESTSLENLVRYEINRVFNGATNSGDDLSDSRVFVEMKMNDGTTDTRVFRSIERVGEEVVVINTSSLRIDETTRAINDTELSSKVYRNIINCRQIG